MPRLTHDQFQAHRQTLRFLWEEASSVYGFLPYNEQRLLHDYFKPTLDLTDAELRTHRAEMMVKRPSMASQAGRTLRKLDRIAAVWSRQSQAERTGKPLTGKARVITVHPIAKPVFDAHALSRALINLAIQKVDKERRADLQQRDTS